MICKEAALHHYSGVSGSDFQNLGECHGVEATEQDRPEMTGARGCLYSA